LTLSMKLDIENRNTFHTFCLQQKGDLNNVFNEIYSYMLENASWKK
jgi:hypothetical protein